MDLKDWRQRKGLTQDEAAKLCGVTPRNWWRWEKKLVEPRLSDARKIILASGGDVTIMDLVKTSQEP